MSDSKNSLLNSGTALAAATAFLYCVGTAYYGGYLSTLQLDANVLDRNFHQVLYNGFLICFAPAFLALGAYTVASFAYSHAFLPELNDWLRQSRSRRRRYLKLKHRLLGKRKDSSIERRQKKRTVIAFAYSAAGLILISVLAYFESEGKKAASATLEKLEAKPLQANNFIFVKIEDQQRSLVYLTCGARNCAGIDPATRRIYYFPQNGHAYQRLATTNIEAPPPTMKAP